MPRDHHPHMASYYEWIKSNPLIRSRNSLTPHLPMSGCTSSQMWCLWRTLCIQTHKQLNYLSWCSHCIEDLSILPCYLLSESLTIYFWGFKSTGSCYVSETDVTLTLQTQLSWSLLCSSLLCLWVPGNRCVSCASSHLYDYLFVLNIKNMFP